MTDSLDAARRSSAGGCELVAQDALALKTFQAQKRLVPQLAYAIEPLRRGLRSPRLSASAVPRAA